MLTSVPVVRGVVRGVQALAPIPAVWHVWLATLSFREAAGGHNEEAIFTAIGDPVVMAVVQFVAAVGLNLSLVGLNAIGIGTWLVLGALGMFLAHRVGRRIAARQEPPGKGRHAAA
jgi:hypothetical protein